MPILIVFLFLFSSTVLAEALPATNFQVTHNFINKMAKDHHFNKDELHLIFSKVNLIVADKNPKPSKKRKKSKPLSWDKYRTLFITDKRI
ncbi:MAG: hypothetical protein ABGX60_02280, partial [Candidatus Thioglobus sp.]